MTNAPLTVKDWLFCEITRRKGAGLIPPIRRGAAMRLAKQLEDQMAQDARDGKCERALSAQSIRVRLYDNKLWP